MIEIVFAAALATQIQPEQWHYAADAGTALFAIDVANIREVGDKKRFHYVGVIDPTTQNGDDVYGLTFAEIDCAEETMRLLQQTNYINGVASPSPFSRDLVYITPGTISVSFYNVVCGGNTDGAKAPSIALFAQVARQLMANR